MDKNNLSVAQGCLVFLGFFIPYINMWSFYVYHKWLYMHNEVSKTQKLLLSFLTIPMGFIWIVFLAAVPFMDITDSTVEPMPKEAVVACYEHDVFYHMYEDMGEDFDEALAISGERTMEKFNISEEEYDELRRDGSLYLANRDNNYNWSDCDGIRHRVNEHSQ